MNKPIVNKTEQNVAIAQPKVNKPTHRYFCDACTGIAFYHIEGQGVPRMVKCKACGKVQSFKEENLIKL